VSGCIDHGYKGNGKGYAKVHRPTGRDEIVYLHRWIFAREHGYYPEVVMHSCDNTRCINLEHLVGGTRDMNNKDCAAKGRSAKAQPTQRRFTQAQVDEIRVRWAGRGKRCLVNGASALAREFGVNRSSIYDICEQRTYVL